MLEVLDYGFVRLVGNMGDDLSIIRNARVSHDAAWRAGNDEGSDVRLLNYLYRNGHSTPFEASVFTFEVKAPIFVIRQWHRHRTWAYNEVSARYKELPEEYYIPTIGNIGYQSKNNKQMRNIIADITDEERKEREEEILWVQEHCLQAFMLYHKLLGREWPRELARTVLPLATYTHMFGTVNLNNLFKFLGERLHEHAQYEIRVYAQAMLDLIEPIVPVSVEAFKKTLGAGYDL